MLSNSYIKDQRKKRSLMLQELFLHTFFTEILIWNWWIGDYHDPEISSVMIQSFKTWNEESSQLKTEKYQYPLMRTNKGNNKITEIQTILQRESQNS